MIRRNFNRGVLGLAFTPLVSSLTEAAPAVPTGDSGEFVALSLSALVRRARSAQGRGEIANLGGITRIVGFVYDTAGDVVLVGVRLGGCPEITPDDLAVALICRLKLDVWPMVSIDPDEATATTRTQRVSFKGIDRSAFGLAFYRSDLFLKHYSLNALPEVATVKSFRTLVGESALLEARKPGAEPAAIRWVQATGGNTTEPDIQHGRFTERSSMATRFWYFARDPRLLVRKTGNGDGIFCIDELRLGVQIEPIGTAKDPIGQSDAVASAAAFAAGIERNLGLVGAREPAVQRLKGLYDLVAVAEGIRRLKPPTDLRYLWEQYPITPVDIPNRHELIQMVGMVHRGSTLDHVTTIAGGISFESQLQWLNDGDVTPLRDIVLKTRPAADALSWPLPLNAWKMPNAQDLTKRDLDAIARPRGSNGRPGFVLSTRSFSPEMGPETALNGKIHQAPTGLPSGANMPRLPGLPALGTVPTALTGGAKAPVVGSQLLAPPQSVAPPVFTAPQLNYFDKRGGVKIDISSIGTTQERGGELGGITRGVLGGRP